MHVSTAVPTKLHRAELSAREQDRQGSEEASAQGRVCGVDTLEHEFETAADAGQCMHNRRRKLDSRPEATQA